MECRIIIRLKKFPYILVDQSNIKHVIFCDLGFRRNLLRMANFVDLKDLDCKRIKSLCFINRL